MLNVDVNILIDIKGLMTSKVEGFKLKERLDLKMSYSVLHSLLNDCKNKIGGNNGKLKKVHLWNDIDIHITHLCNSLKL